MKSEKERKAEKVRLRKQERRFEQDREEREQIQLEKNRQRKYAIRYTLKVLGHFSIPRDFAQNCA